MPALNVSTLDGTATALSSVLSGRAAVVSLWATWCDACEQEFAALNRLSGTGALVVGVAVGEERANVASFLARHPLHYPQLVDEQFALADALGERRVPATLVVDKEGRVVFRGGALDERALAALRGL